MLLLLRIFVWLPCCGIRHAGGALVRRLSVKLEKEYTLYYQRQRDSRGSVVVIVVRPWDGDLEFDSRQEEESPPRKMQTGARVHQAAYGV